MVSLNFKFSIRLIFKTGFRQVLSTGIYLSFFTRNKVGVFFLCNLRKFEVLLFKNVDLHSTTTSVLIIFVNSTAHTYLFC